MLLTRHIIFLNVKVKVILIVLLLICFARTSFKNLLFDWFWPLEFKSVAVVIHKNFKLLPGQQIKFKLRGLQIFLPFELGQQMTLSLPQFLPNTVKKYIGQISFHILFVAINHLQKVR